MFITVDVARAVVGLTEADVFTEFHVVAEPRDAAGADVGTALGVRGAPHDDDHVWIGVDAVRELAGAGEAVQEWNAGFDAMLGYATSKGWMSPDGTQIRAHIDRGD